MGPYCKGSPPAPLDMFKLVELGPHCTRIPIPPPMKRSNFKLHLASGRFASYWNASCFWYIWPILTAEILHCTTTKEQVCKKLMKSWEHENNPVGCAPPVCDLVSVATTRCHSDGGPKWTSLNKSPVITTRCHWVSYLTFLGGGLYLTFPKGVVHYHVTYSMMYLMILYSGVVTRLFIGS